MDDIKLFIIMVIMIIDCISLSVFTHVHHLDLDPSLHECSTVPVVVNHLILSASTDTHDRGIA